MFDPEHPEKSLVLKEGRVVEVTDLDLEQGGNVEMTGLEEETKETLSNNTVNNIEDRRTSKDDKPGLETEKYRLEEEEEEEEVVEEEEGFPHNIWKSQSSQQSGSDIEGGCNCAGLAGRRLHLLTYPGLTL